MGNGLPPKPSPSFDHVVAPASMTTTQAARWLTAQGATVREAHGIHWARKPAAWGGSRGFWLPVAELSPVAAEQVQMPRTVALGCRAVVRDPLEATGSMPMWFIEDLADFNEGELSKVQRRTIRVGSTRAEIAKLEEPTLLLEQGWPIVQAASQRRSGKLLAWAGKQEFQRSVVSDFAAGGTLVITATVGESLVGFCRSHAIDSVAYFTHLYLSEQGRSLAVGAALEWAMIRSWQRAPVVESLSFGPQTPELTGLSDHKLSMGIPRVDMPVVTRMRRPVATFLKRRRPETYFRSGLGSPTL